MKEVKIVNQTLRDIPMRRYGITGEIASTVLFMCSKASGFVTGQTLRANGGQMMGF